MLQKQNVKVLAKCQWKFRFSLQSNCWRNVLFPKLQNLNCINPLQMGKILLGVCFRIVISKCLCNTRSKSLRCGIFFQWPFNSLCLQPLKNCWNPHYISQTANYLVLILRLNGSTLIKRDKLEFHWEIGQQITWKG